MLGITRCLQKADKSARLSKLVIGPTYRCCSSQPRPQTSSDEFIPVYRLPLIVGARAICRLKLYQSAAVAGLTGYSLACDADLTLPLVLSAVSLAMLGIMGEFFRRLVGLLYVNPAKNQVKIAHLTFWGNRKEVIVNINDIVPISDSKDRYSDVFVKINFYEKSLSPFYMSIYYGQICDKDLFKTVLGEDVESL